MAVTGAAPGATGPDLLKPRQASSLGRLQRPVQQQSLSAAPLSGGGGCVLISKGAREEIFCDVGNVLQLDLVMLYDCKY